MPSPKLKAPQAPQDAQKGNPRTLYLRIGPNGLFSARHTDAGKRQLICSKTTTLRPTFRCTHHETHQREAENLSRASASRYCFRSVEPHNGRTVRQGSRPLLQMAEILHRQNQTPRKRHRPQSSHRYSRQRNAQLHQSHQRPQRT